MTKPLVVVESPTKVKTLKQYLGKDYNVVATVGHIKDLPAKEIVEKYIKKQKMTFPVLLDVHGDIEKKYGV